MTVRLDKNVKYILHLICGGNNAIKGQRGGAMAGLTARKSPATYFKMKEVYL